MTTPGGPTGAPVPDELAAVLTSQQIPAGRVVRQAAKHLFDELTEVLDACDREGDLLQRRQMMMPFLLRARAVLLRLFVLVKWIRQSHKRMEPLFNSLNLLASNEFMFRNAKEILVPQNLPPDPLNPDVPRNLPPIPLRFLIERWFYPPWDFNTSLHVLSSGSYNHFPLFAMQMLGLTKEVPKAVKEFCPLALQSFNRRFLISNPQVVGPDKLPLTVKEWKPAAVVLESYSFDVTLSLRMGPPEEAIAENSENINSSSFSEDNGRFKWKVIDLSITILVSDLEQQTVVNRDQIMGLLGFCNHQLHNCRGSSAHSLTKLYCIIQTFCSAVQLQLYVSQNRILVSRFPPGSFKFEYNRLTSFTIRYWLDSAVKPSFTISLQKYGIPVTGTDTKEFTKKLVLEASDKRLTAALTNTFDVEKESVDLVRLCDRVMLLHMGLMMNNLHNCLHSIFLDTSYRIVEGSSEDSSKYLSLYLDHYVLFISIDSSNGTFKISLLEEFYAEFIDSSRKFSLDVKTKMSLKNAENNLNALFKIYSDDESHLSFKESSAAKSFLESLSILIAQSESHNLKEIFEQSCIFLKKMQLKNVKKNGLKKKIL